MLKIDGFDSALVGIASVWKDGGERVDTLIYDGERIVTILCEQSGMSYDEAIEYISFNIEDAYVGENTPIIVWSCDMDHVRAITSEDDE